MLARALAICLAVLVALPAPSSAARDLLAGVRHAPEGTPIRLTLRNGDTVLGTLVGVRDDQVVARGLLASRSMMERLAPLKAEDGAYTFGPKDVKAVRVVMPGTETSRLRWIAVIAGAAATAFVVFIAAFISGMDQIGGAY